MSDQICILYKMGFLNMQYARPSEHLSEFSPYSKAEHLCTNIKLTLPKALIRSVITDACPTWGHAADTQLSNLQHLQNKVPPNTGHFPIRTLVHNLHTGF